MDNKIKKEINEYISSRKIAHQLADKITTGEELNDFLKQEVNRQILSERLRDRSGRAEEIYHAIDSRDKKTDINRMVNRLEQKNNQSKRNRLISVISGAAAILLIAVLVNHFNNQGLDPLSTTIETAQVEKQEISSPTLIYDFSGEEIVLQKNQNLSLNGTNIAKVEENKLEYLNNNTEDIQYATLMMPKQTKFTVVLHDGSEVCLNAKSRLRYPSRFVGSERVVELEGEAYFKVKKGDRPFKVIVQGVEVTVYGTEFNIAAYNHDKIVTTLITGSVGVRYMNNNQSVERRIKPSERITIETLNGREWIEKGVKTEKYKAWQENYFRHDEEPLQELLESLSNWYGIEFSYSNEAIKNKTVSASLRNDMEIDNILKILELTSNIKFIKEGGTYVVK